MPDDPLDLSGLDLAPDWVKEIKSPSNDFPAFKEDRRIDGDGPRRPKGKRPPRREDRGGPRRNDGPRSDGPRRGGPRRDDGPGRGRGPRRDGKGGGPRGERDRGRDGRGGGRDQRENRRPQAPPIEGFKVKLTPLDPGVQYLVQQIRMTGRAYPIFDLAKLLLESRERYTVSISRENGSSPPLFRCAADGSLWLSREEAVRHLLNSKAIGEYYEIETIEGDPPKGNFTTVAVCGMSGKLLGPPNYHGYQPALNRLYRERFSNMDFERFKSRIKMSQEEETIEKWKEQESTTTHYRPKGEEETVLKDRTALEQHFRDHHAGTVEEVENGTIPGDAGSKRMLAGPLNALVRNESDAQRRFPLDVMQFLCRKFEEAGLKFFKKGKKRTFVTLSRPRQIPTDVSFSEGIHRIVDFVRYNPGATLNKLAGMLIPKEERSSEAREKKPQPEKAETAPAEDKTEEVGAPIESAVAETGEKPERDGEQAVVTEAPVEDEKFAADEKEPTHESSVEEEATDAPDGPEAAVPATTTGEESPAESASSANEPTEPTTEASKETESTGAEPAPPSLSDAEVAVLQDLRWLVREGYVIEFNDGKLFLPEERQEQPKKKPKKKKEASKDKTGKEAAMKSDSEAKDASGNRESLVESEKENPATETSANEDVTAAPDPKPDSGSLETDSEGPMDESAPVVEAAVEDAVSDDDQGEESTLVSTSNPEAASPIEQEREEPVALVDPEPVSAAPVSDEEAGPDESEINTPQEESTDPVPVS
ncbi:MAG: hypothetical protein AAGJ79_04615 [Verrucomicrobiota bacterium]